MTFLEALIDRCCRRLDRREPGDAEMARDEFMLGQFVPPPTSQRKPGRSKAYVPRTT